MININSYSDTHFFFFIKIHNENVIEHNFLFRFVFRFEILIWTKVDFKYYSYHEFMIFCIQFRDF